MPDLEISNLPALAEAGVQANDPVAVADLSASATKKVSVKDLIAAGVALIDDAAIPAVKVATPFAANSVATATVQDQAISAVKILNDCITANQIAPNAIGASELADNSVDSGAVSSSAIIESKIASSAVTESKIASSAVTTSKVANSSITYAKLNLSAGDIPGDRISSASITSTQLASNSITDSELSNDSVQTDSILDNAITASKIGSNVISSSHLSNNSVTSSAIAANAVESAAINSAAITTAKVGDAQITAQKLASNLPGSILATGAIGSSQIAVNAITSSELADNSVDSASIINAAVTDAKIAGVSGTKITSASIPASALNTANIDRSLNISSGSLGINNNVVAATRSGISYNSEGLITGTVALSSSDLPLAGASSVGGVSVPTSGGLTVSGAGAISIAATTTGTTKSGITYNSFGQITGSTALVSSDIPTSSTSIKGGVIIQSGGGLSVDSSGNLTTSTSGISAGTYGKLTVNNKGIATAGASLVSSDIPDLDSSKITTGTIAAARIAADSIDGTKLSNSSTAIIQSVAQLGFPTAQYTGQLLFDPIDESAWLHDGNAWNPITTLTKGALQRFGTYDPNASQVTFVTSAGAAAGLTVGQNLPTASESVDGGYVVINNIGTPSGISGITVELKPPDYLLGVTGSSSNWVRIELSDTVASQQASAISLTPYGQIASTNVQAGIQELEDEKVSKAGSTITGELLIGTTGSLVFEGSSADNFELTLACANPTLSDKTLTLPDITGTLITSGDTNTVTSTMVDGSLVNTNLSATAGIQLSKLETLASGKIIVGSSSGVAIAVNMTGDISIDDAGLTAIGAAKIVDSMVSGSAAITGTKIQSGTTSNVGVLQLTDSTSSTSTTTAATANSVKTVNDALTTTTSTANAALPASGGSLTGNLIVDNAKEVRFSEADTNGANYLALKAPSSVTADITWTLPDGDGSANQFLKTDGSGNLSWGSDNSTDPTKLPLAGGSMAGVIAMGTNKITGLGNPTAAQDAATKTYVDGADTTGNAATASALATARNIGGVSFDGSADINLPGVNAGGNQDTTGNAATASTLATSRNINGTAFNGSADITITAAAGTLTGSTLASGITGSSLTGLGTLSSLNVSGDINASGTGAIKIPVGSTAQRPGSPSVGQFRWNSTTSSAEIYNGTSFAPVGGAGATGGGLDQVFVENSYQITENYELSSGKNAVSVGVLQIDANKTVTIPSGRTWVVL